MTPALPPTGRISDRTYRIVIPSSRGRPNREMDAIGWLLFLGRSILLVPLLPLVLGALLVDRLVTRHRTTRG